jgi:dipeptidyl aminopeptidase/acylaminoacyl peptidase
MRLPSILRSCLGAVLLPALAACAARLPGPEADRLASALFAPPTAEEMRAVEAEWAARDTGAADVRVEWRDDGRGGARTLVLSHVVDGFRHYGAVRVPAGAAGRRLPVLLIAHGGEKGTSGLQFFRDGPVADGWIQVLPTFRSERLYIRPTRWYRSEGRPSPWDRDVDDAMALLSAALREVPEADGDRVVVLGRSRGGGVALLMAVRDPRVDAVVDYFGPTDFFLPAVRRLGERALRSRVPRLPGANYLADSVLFALRDGRIGVGEARLALLRRSPVYFADRLPPVLIHHGTDDPEVAFAHSERLVDVLGRTTGAVWEYHPYPGGGHRAHTLEGHEARTAAFLQRVAAGPDSSP